MADPLEQLLSQNHLEGLDQAIAEMLAEREEAGEGGRHQSPKLVE